MLDLGLPRLDGYQVASRLRQELDGPLVIIAITGHSEANDRRIALESGCDFYFLKPVDPVELMPLLASERGTPSSPRISEQGPQADSLSSVRREVEIVNALGIHLRAADKFVKLAEQFHADVQITYDGRTASGASILDVTTLAAPCGSNIELSASGLDAKEAIDALAKLIERRFDEQE